MRCLCITFALACNHKCLKALVRSKQLQPMLYHMRKGLCFWTRHMCWALCSGPEKNSLSFLQRDNSHSNHKARQRLLHLFKV